MNINCFYSISADEAATTIPPTLDAETTTPGNVKLLKNATYYFYTVKLLLYRLKKITF